MFINIKTEIIMLKFCTKADFNFKVLELKIYLIIYILIIFYLNFDICFDINSVRNNSDLKFL